MELFECKYSMYVLFFMFPSFLCIIVYVNFVFMYYCLCQSATDKICVENNLSKLSSFPSIKFHLYLVDFNWNVNNTDKHTYPLNMVCSTTLTIYNNQIAQMIKDLIKLDIEQLIAKEIGEKKSIKQEVVDVSMDSSKSGTPDGNNADSNFVPLEQSTEGDGSTNDTSEIKSTEDDGSTNDNIDPLEQLNEGDGNKNDNTDSNIAPLEQSNEGDGSTNDNIDTNEKQKSEFSAEEAVSPSIAISEFSTASSQTIEQFEYVTPKDCTETPNWLERIDLDFLVEKCDTEKEIMRGNIVALQTSLVILLIQCLCIYFVSNV